MSYYNWEKIVGGYSESELKRIYNDKEREPSEKVDAAVKELIVRGILSPDLGLIPKPTIEDSIVNIPDITNANPNKRIAIYASIAIALVFIVDIAIIISSIMQYNLLKYAKEGSAITTEMAYNNDLREQIVMIVYLFVFLLSAILFIIWFKRAYDNLHQRIKICEFDAGWAIGSWVVPIISLFRPYNIMNELVEKTNIILTHRGINNRNNKPLYVGLWWTLWLITHIITRNTLRLSFNPGTINEFIFFTVFNIVLACLEMVLVIITILMIKRYSENEDLLFNGEINTTSSSS